MAPTTTECSCCANDIEGEPTLVEGDLVCEDCVRGYIIPKFRAALLSVANYPVTWGKDDEGNDVELSVYEFQKYFDDWDDVQQTWELRKKEKEFDADKRLYCRQCASFLRGLPFSPDKAKNASAYCDKCQIEVCGACGVGGHTANACDAKKDEKNPFEGMADTKKCPKCGTAFYLYDGCNLIDCAACKAKFCWVCLEINPDRLHWAEGTPCPKFGQPGDANAHWINPDQDAAANAARPLVAIPPEMATYLPRGPHSADQMAQVAALAFLDIRGYPEELSQQAVEARWRLAQFPGFQHGTHGASWEERRERAQRVSRDLAAGFGDYNRAGVDKHEDPLRKAGVLAEFVNMNRLLADNAAMLHDRLVLEANLEQFLERHRQILEARGVVRRKQVLRKSMDFVKFFSMLTVYLMVAGERLAVAASDRLEHRIHNQWEVAPAEHAEEHPEGEAEEEAAEA